jgi:putative ABC transport system permease protein
MAQAISVVKEVWTKYYDESLFTYFYQDQYFNTQYHSDTQLSKLFSTGCIIAIIISCLGLYGFVLLSTERNKKSIGLRKVNGATVVDILILLNREYLYRVVIAFVIATPIAYYAMQKWLENFAYRTDLNWWIFAAAGFSTFLIAILIVIRQSYKAATRNPVEALRSE